MLTLKYRNVKRQAFRMSKWQNHIVSTPNVLNGKPRIRDTRIPVGLILGYLAIGKNAAEIIAEFPDLTQEQIASCCEYAQHKHVSKR